MAQVAYLVQTSDWSGASQVVGAEGRREILTSLMTVVFSDLLYDMSYRDGGNHKLTQVIVTKSPNQVIVLTNET